MNLTSDQDLTKPAVYKITIKGQLGSQWESHFSGLELSIETDEHGDHFTILKGLLTDQSALHGVLTYIRDLGLQLLGVEYIHK